MKKLLKIISLPILLLLVVAVVKAEPGGSISEDFNFLISQPKPAAYWWIKNCGDGICTQTFEADASKVEVGHGTQAFDYARLSIFPDWTPGDYNNAEIAEVNTGELPLDPARWLPTTGSPVTVEMRVRWSPDYQLDGTGAVGTNGMLLWNSPLDFSQSEGFTEPITFIGFMWAEQGNPFAGLVAVVFRENISIGVFPIHNVILSDWNTFKLVWRTANPGETTHQITFYMNGQLLGQTHPFPAVPALSAEIWNDNQVYSFATNTSTFGNPTTTQTFDLDYINISQP